LGKSPGIVLQSVSSSAPKQLIQREGSGPFPSRQFAHDVWDRTRPVIADGSVALGNFFGQITRERAWARVVVHPIIAVGDYVCARELSESLQ
jgi:hypothetical protein